MSIFEKLLKIQTELKAPKGQYNSFGKYHYRSCEDILEGLKPLLEEHKATLVINDEITQIGDRYYVKATATLIDAEEGQEITSTSYAREDETKKGMDLSQVTGSTSSYARKYALNGLFCIDDTKDSDSTNTHGKTKDKPAKTDDKPKQSSSSKKENKEANSGSCVDCGVEIKPAVETYSKQYYGKGLCMDCQKKNVKQG
ncbi:ERF family protein [Alkaliphilus sp. B6464]|uniref:ERF family protein n=1 Tax=Alkaliphilus sp. B6464 TaxID=2731219 RepID=UPI001BABF1B9|nr:ERF family protein [Alkaliphilus sp. B6464]QUH21453.1 ERF family protein [Alkaliphilus sp. B6464]